MAKKKIKTYKIFGVIQGDVPIDLNGIEIEDPEMRLYKGMMEIAKGNSKKEDFYHILKNLYES